MSTIKVNNIVPPNVGEGVSIDGLQMPTAGALSNRNRIINGDMQIDQRYAGAAATYGVGAGYVLDRWQGATTIASNMQFQKVSDAPVGFTSSHKVTALTGATITSSDYFVLIQNIEGLNTSDLGFGAAGAESVTLSFWVKSSVTGTHSGSLRNNGGTRSYPFTYSISSANTWEKKAITIAGDTTGTWLTTNGIGLSVIFDLGTGSSFRGTAGSWSASNFVGATSSVSPMATSGATWFITGVQLEPGTVATPFERRNFDDELDRCKRYFTKSYPQGFAPGISSIYGGGVIYRSNTATTTPPYIPVRFEKELRTTPDIEIYSPDIGAIDRVSIGIGIGGAQVAVLAGVSSQGATAMMVYPNYTSATAYYNCYFQYTAEAELL